MSNREAAIEGLPPAAVAQLDKWAASNGIDPHDETWVVVGAATRAVVPLAAHLVAGEHEEKTDESTNHQAVLEDYCYRVGEALGLRLLPVNGEEVGRVIPLEWEELPAYRGYAREGEKAVRLSSSYFFTLAGAGRDMRRPAAVVYVHECAHRIVGQVTKRLKLPRTRLAWGFGHDYPFAVLCWALQLRLQLNPEFFIDDDLKWWTYAPGPRWYDVQDGIFVPLDGSTPLGQVSPENGFPKMIRWWSRAVVAGVELVKTDLTPHQIAEKAIRDYIRMTTPPPPKTRWERVMDWLSG